MPAASESLMRSFDQAKKSLPHRNTLTPESVGGTFTKVSWSDMSRRTQDYVLEKWKGT